MTDRPGFIELPVVSAGPVASGPHAGDPILGIDLGTTNSLVAIVQDGKPRVLKTREGRNLLPSVVHFLKNGDASVGFAAKTMRSTDPSNTIFSVKRLLGRGAADVRDIRDHLPYTIDESDPANVRIQVQGRLVTPIEISAMILRELKQSAEEALGREVEDAVITVPAYFNDSQRQATRAAGRLAGLNVLRILNEPTAAALAFGLQKKKNGLIAVYDMGGGTFDVSILKLKDGIFEVLSTNGDTQLGGDDIDQVVSVWLGIELQKKEKIDLQTADVRATLLEAAETLKIRLADANSATVEVKFGKKTFSLKLTRTQLAELAKSVLERSKGPVEAALRDAKLTRDQITDVVLVGGPTRLWFLREYVKELFGREPNSSMHPDEVVAEGAAVQADILAGGNQDLLLLDVVPLSLGIETFGGAMSKLIPRNTRIPTLAKESFTTYVEGQTKIAINVYQGERELIAENRKLAEFVLKGVPPLPAGIPRVEVTFLVDADGILSVSAREHYSGIASSIEVKPTYGLTDSEVERMLEDGMNNADHDLRVRRVIDARNDATPVLQAVEKSLPLVKDKLSAAEVKSIEEHAARLKLVMGGDNADAIKSAHKALDKASTHMAEILMNQTVTTGLKNAKASDILKKS